MLAGKFINRIIFAVLAPIIIFLAAKTIAYNQSLEIRNCLYDNFFRAKFYINDFYNVCDKDIVILDIDNRSLQELGNFNRFWSRSYFGKVIGNIKKDEARAVFLDILFKGVISGHDNQVLVDSLKSAGNVFLGIYLIPDKNTLKKVPELQYFDSKAKNEDRIDFLSSENVDFSYHDLVMSSESVGFTNCVTDRDGVLRHIPLLMLYRRLLYSSASMQMWAKLNNLSHANAIFRSNGITYSDFCFIPSDRNSYVKVNYQGLKNSFKYYSFIDIFNSNYRKGIFKNKIVMIGSSSPVFGDLKKIPGGIIPGVQVHAATLSMLMKGNFVKVLNPYFEFVISIFCGFISTFYIYGISIWKSFGRLCLTILSIILLAFIIFYGFSYFINMTSVVLTSAFFMAANIFRKILA